jgi:hypothetical protein
MILNILTTRGDDRGATEVPEAICIDASLLPRSVPRLLNVLFSMEPRLPRLFPPSHFWNNDVPSVRHIITESQAIESRVSCFSRGNLAGVAVLSEKVEPNIE